MSKRSFICRPPSLPIAGITPEPPPPPGSVEKLSCTEPVAGAKMVGTRCFGGSLLFPHGSWHLIEHHSSWNLMEHLGQ